MDDQAKDRNYLFKYNTLIFRPVDMKNIAVFASGEGSNARQLIDYFKVHPHIRVTLIVTNNPKAKVIELANEAGISALIFNKQQFTETTQLLDELRIKKIDLIALAGFLWLIPNPLIKAFPNKILNIHPALLPKYGGKGMYGSAVHKAVIADKETYSGISIHFVNEKYDEGQILLQVKCQVDSGETTESLAVKIHQLEHANYAHAIEDLLCE